MVWKGKRFLFVADDFGLHTQANEAIIYSHDHGVLDSAALMMGQPGTAEAVKWAWRRPRFQVGLHFHLNDSVPFSGGEWPWGASPGRAGRALGLSFKARRLARKEIQAQWQAFVDTGLYCSFINFHHHLHLHPWVYREVLKTVQGSFHGWIRLGTPRAFSGGPKMLSLLCSPWMRWRRNASFYHSPNYLWGMDRTFAMQVDEVAAVMKKPSAGVHEFIFHPRRVEGDLDTQCLIDLKKLALQF